MQFLYCLYGDDDRDDVSFLNDLVTGNKSELWRLAEEHRSEANGWADVDV